MRSRRFALLLVLLPLSCLIAFLGVSIDVSAVYEGGQFMSASDFREILGDDIVCEYFNGTEYVEGHFYYYGITDGLTFRDDSLTDVSSYQLLRYTTSLPNLSYSNEYITVHLSPKFSITDTKIINTFVGMRTQYDVSASAYNQSTWEWMFGGNTVPFTAPAYDGNYRNSYIGGNNYCTIPVQMSSDQLTSGYSFDVKFYGAGAVSNAQLIIGVPYISADASVAEGTLPPVTTAPSSSGDINVSVDVDLSETNGFLGSIADSLSDLGSSIVDGISGLFIPDEDDIEGFKDTLSDILSDTFGGIPDLEDDLIDTIESIFTATATSSVHFEGIAIPNGSGGYTSIVAPHDVPLKPDGYTALFNFAKTLVNIIATIATFNTLRHIKDKVIVGEVIIDAD